MGAQRAHFLAFRMHQLLKVTVDTCDSDCLMLALEQVLSLWRAPLPWRWGLSCVLCDAGVASLCIGLRVSGFCPKVHVQGPGVLWGSLAQSFQWPLQRRGLVVE